MTEKKGKDEAAEAKAKAAEEKAAKAAKIAEEKAAKATKVAEEKAAKAAKAAEETGPKITDAEMKAIRVEAERVALKKVQEIMGIDDAFLANARQAKESQGVMCTYDLGMIPIWVNGKRIPNSGTAPRHQVVGWTEMASKARTRRIMEKFSTKYEIEMLGKNVTSKIVGHEDADGTPVSIAGAI